MIPKKGRRQRVVALTYNGLPRFVGKGFLEITYCSTPWLFWDYSLRCVPPFMLWVLFHMLCVWPHMVQACVLIVTPSPHHPSLILSK